ILYWVRNFALRTYEKTAPQGEVLVELDEMGTFCVQKNKVWFWKAYCRTTGELVDWECGNRSTQL
ncbi:MAG: IS1 family transposase, partial [Nitrososphaerota archaeon]|nr:IS1 family transposase [Nitrososphaerota archaeon]